VNEKERARLHDSHRTDEAERKTHDVEAQINSLERLLQSVLGMSIELEFDSLKQPLEPTPYEPGKLATPIPPPAFTPPPEPNGLAKMFGGKRRYEVALQKAQQEHADAAAIAKAEDAKRVEKLQVFKARNDEEAAAARAQAEAQHREVDEFEQRYAEAQPDAVREYCMIVLARSSYPEGFPQERKIAYEPESKQLVVELDFPTLDVIPTTIEFKYVKAKDQITTKAWPEAKRKGLYASVIAQMTLRTIFEFFGADKAGHIETIVFNGHVDTRDPRTGQQIHPCLVTVRVTRDAFDALELAEVDPAACLKGLSASISRSPTELEPVRPILEFSMVDPRFVETADLLAELDERPNLMNLSPTEFEALITNLFEKMGLETRRTQASRDGGVDCVAYDSRPILGGKVVIQAKRYKNTVGVSAVRDLFGTLQNEGASKGILVTTSGYGQASFQFAENKPIELISGANLLYLLSEHAGIEAKIEPPEDWLDPAADVTTEAQVDSAASSG